MNRLLSYLLSVTVESRYAAKEIYHLILSLYSKIAPPLPSRLLSTPRPRSLHRRNVLGQSVIPEWRHGARAEQRRSLDRDVKADLVRIPRKRRSTRSASQMILTTGHPVVPPRSRITTWLLLTAICQLRAQSLRMICVQILGSQVPQEWIESSKRTKMPQ
jgi:hypothetical protein